MKKIKESSNDHIYLLDHANEHCGEQTDGEVSKGSRDSQNLSQVSSVITVCQFKDTKRNRQFGFFRGQ